MTGDGAPEGTGSDPSGGERRATREAGDGPDLLAAAVERMAHQLKNPLQAVAVNLEVIRGRVRGQAPELWEGLERFGRAVDDNVSLLDRRFRLLLALGRRGPDDELRDVDPAALAVDLAAALRLDEEAPGIEVVRSPGDDDGPAARLRPGHLLAFLLDAWLAAARAGAERTPVEIRRSSGSLGLAFPVPRSASDGRDRWREMARVAGGELEEVEDGELEEGEGGEAGEETTVHVRFPTA